MKESGGVSKKLIIQITFEFIRVVGWERLTIKKYLPDHAAMCPSLIIFLNCLFCFSSIIFPGNDPCGQVEWWKEVWIIYGMAWKPRCRFNNGEISRTRWKEAGAGKPKKERAFIPICRKKKWKNCSHAKELPAKKQRAVKLASPAFWTCMRIIHFGIGFSPNSVLRSSYRPNQVSEPSKTGSKRFLQKPSIIRPNSIMGILSFYSNKVLKRFFTQWSFMSKKRMRHSKTILTVLLRSGNRK